MDDFSVPEDKCRNPLGKNTDDLVILAAKFISDLVVNCIKDGGRMTRFGNRKTKVITDTIQISVLYGNQKIDGCKVLPPGLALFPDKGNTVSAGRQDTDAADGFTQPNGCQYRTCTQMPQCTLHLMLCCHVVCSNCTKTYGVCLKCEKKCVANIEKVAVSKKNSRKKKFGGTQHLHLSKV